LLVGGRKCCHAETSNEIGCTCNPVFETIAGAPRVFGASDNWIMDWQPISTASFDGGLELAVLDAAGRSDPRAGVSDPPHLGGWINAETRQRIEVSPTHWRTWRERL